MPIPMRPEVLKRSWKSVWNCSNSFDVGHLDKYLQSCTLQAVKASDSTCLESEELLADAEEL